MDFDGLDRQLRDSLADLKLSNEERDELRQLGSEPGTRPGAFPAQPCLRPGA